MKKIILFILLLLPMFVYAEECTNEISIEGIEFIKVEGKASERSAAVIENQEVKFDISFGKLNDSVEYKLTIKNNSEEDYQIDKNSIKSESKNVSYTLNYGKSSVIEAGKEKEISLIIKYDKKIDNSLFVDNAYSLDNEMSFSLINTQQDNPLTRGNALLEFVVIVLAWVLILMAIYRKKKTDAVVGVLLLFVPLFVNALCTMTIKTNSHFVIEKVPVTRCHFDGNLEVGAEYTNGQYIYRYKKKASAASWILKDLEYGWSMQLADMNSTDPITSDVCTFIDDIPVTSYSYAFLSSEAESVDLSSFNTSYVTDMEGMFRRSSLKNIDLSTFDTSNVKTMWGMFENVDLNGVDLSYLDTSNVESMVYMFGNIDIDTLDLSTFDVSNVKSMRQMFWGAHIRNLDLSHFNNPKLEDTEEMFEEFEGNVNLKGFKTDHVTNMRDMFAKAKTNNIDFSTFNTSNVTNMDHMFEKAEIDTVDISSFTTESVTKITGLFIWSKVRVIDISGFRTGTLVEMYNTFIRSENLETIYASSEFDPSLLNENTRVNFGSTSKLYGGQGTYCEHVGTHDTEKNYMKVDGGPTDPGCFTLKQ